jgi:hypothetical protein
MSRLSTSLWSSLPSKAWALGVPPEHEAAEAAMNALQNGVGIPDDLSGLDDP